MDAIGDAERAGEGAERTLLAAGADDVEARPRHPGDRLEREVEALSRVEATEREEAARRGRPHVEALRVDAVPDDDGVAEEGRLRERPPPDVLADVDDGVGARE